MESILKLLKKWKVLLKEQDSGWASATIIRGDTTHSRETRVTLPQVPILPFSPRQGLNQTKSEEEEEEGKRERRNQKRRIRRERERESCADCRVK
jgi:hypothetical protein